MQLINAQKRMYNAQKPCKVTYVTLRRHVCVLYADGALFTHRFVREQRRLGLEIEGIAPYDKPSFSTTKCGICKKLTCR